MEPITIDLGDKRFELKPTYKAMQTISKNNAGLMNALQRLSRLEFETMHDVICAGIGPESLSTPKQRDEIGELIYAAGFTDDTGNLASKCVSFIMLLMRGGKQKAEEGK